MQRFDLRRASGQITNQFIAMATNELRDNSSSVFSKLTYCFDGDEAAFALGESEISIPPPCGDYFIATEGVLIEICAVARPGCNISIGDIDSAYFYSLEDPDDYGMIIVSISLPSSRVEAFRFLGGLAPELRGHLAHEMQHSVQKIVHGQSLSGTSNQGVESHMFDAKEIDARVEEVIAQLKDSVPEDDISAFTTRLKCYIAKYLERNLEKGRHHPQYLMFYGEILNMHLCNYKQKIKAE